MPSPSSPIPTDEIDSQADSTTTASSDTISQNSMRECKIARLVDVYSLEVCERRIIDSADEYQNYRNCLDGCLRFHAGQTSAVAASERRGGEAADRKRAVVNDDLPRDDAWTVGAVDVIADPGRE